jgi:hypothetical protein
MAEARRAHAKHANCGQSQWAGSDSAGPRLNPLGKGFRGSVVSASPPPRSPLRRRFPVAARPAPSAQVRAKLRVGTSRDKRFAALDARPRLVLHAASKAVKRPLPRMGLPPTAGVGGQCRAVREKRRGQPADSARTRLAFLALLQAGRLVHRVFSRRAGPGCAGGVPRSRGEGCPPCQLWGGRRG